jgi:hypothetical protein
MLGVRKSQAVGFLVQNREGVYQGWGVDIGREWQAREVGLCVYVATRRGVNGASRLVRGVVC